MKPLTRKEFFMAKAAGQTVPDLEPITREEYFLNQIAESGGGGGLPAITEGDEGKVLTVDEGAAIWGEGGGGVSITQVEYINEDEYLELHMNSKDLYEAYLNGIVTAAYKKDIGDNLIITFATTIISVLVDADQETPLYHFYLISEFEILEFIGTENEHPKFIFG